MSKDKSLDTRLYHGNGKFNGNHNCPREFFKIYESIKELDFVKFLGIGKFRQTKKGKNLEIIGYDENKNSYVVNIIGEKYEQRLFVKVDERKIEYERILKNFII